MSSEIEDLHEEIFGFRPAKAGTAYERLGAIVVAARGATDVVHDETVTPPGRQATHQLDVTCRLQSGELERVVIEFKDKESGDVGQEVLDHLVGVIAQLGADGGAVVTTCGYTAGAVAVAADENIALLRLRPYDHENPEPFVKKIVLMTTWISNRPVDINVQAELPDGAAGPVQMDTGTNLLHLDGTPAETLLDLFKANSAPLSAEPGRYPREVRFDGSRLFPVPGGEPAQLAAVTWTEVVAHSKETNITEFDGDPLLILERYNDKGEIESGRMVIDLELFAWDIDADGRVTERGSLAGEAEPREERHRVD